MGCNCVGAVLAAWGRCGALLAAWGCAGCGAAGPNPRAQPQLCGVIVPPLLQRQAGVPPVLPPSPQHSARGMR